MKKIIVFSVAMLLVFFVRVNVSHSQSISVSPSQMPFSGNNAPPDLIASTSSAPTSTSADKVTLTGEIVDMDCYMSMGAHGADHKACATKCIASGTPMGLLTTDGKVYVLTAPHDNQDPYNKLKKLAASTVSITGVVYNRGGVQSLEVDDVKM